MTRMIGGREWGRRVLAGISWILTPVLFVSFAILLTAHFHDRASGATALLLGFLSLFWAWVFASLVRERAFFATWPLPLRLVLLLLFSLMSLLAVDTAILSSRYGVSSSVAAKEIVKELGLTGIRLAVAIIDPCEPRYAETGPDAGSAPGLDRIEELSGDRFTLQEVHNEKIIRSNHSFRYQPFDEPRLQILRQKYDLDKVVAPAADEFEAMVLLRGWVRSQFRRADYQPLTANFDALEVLDRNLRNHAGEPYDRSRHFDPCHLFPLLYAQVLLSFGHQTRLVSIGHGMAEVWSNQFKKWVLMDAELNWHYEKDGIPLSLMEVFEENFLDGPTRARIVRGQQSSDPNTSLVHMAIEEMPIERMIQAHRTHLTIVDMRNDWLTNRYFRGHPARSEQNSLVYVDSRLAELPRLEDRLRPRTGRKEDLSWTLNQTEILVRKPFPADTLELVFSTVTPNFQGFEIGVDGAPPITSAAPDYRWQLHDGVNTLTVRSLNQAGVKGILSFVTLEVHPRGR